MLYHQSRSFEIIAATEATASQLNIETAQLLRHRVSSILSAAKPSKINLSKEQQNAVKNLREDKTLSSHQLTIKGKVTVCLYQRDLEAIYKMVDNLYRICPTRK